MGRPATITSEDFAAAAADLLANGQKLTFDSVRKRLGGGSYHVLRRYIDQFEANASAAGGTGIPPLLQALANQARDEALREARAELAADAEALEADRAALAEEQERMRISVATAEFATAELQRQVDALQAGNEALRVRADLESRRAEELAVQLSAALATQSALQRSHDLVVAESALQARQGAEQFARDLVAAQQRFEGLQQHTLRLVDEIRTQHAAAIEQLLANRLDAGMQVLTKAVVQLEHLPQRLVDASAVSQQLGQHVEASVGQAATRVLDALNATRDGLQAHVDAAVLRVNTVPAEPADAGDLDTRPPARPPSGKTRR